MEIYTTKSKEPIAQFYKENISQCLSSNSGPVRAVPVKQLFLNDKEIQSGVNIYKGELVNEQVAHALNLPFKDLKGLTEN